MIIIVHTPKRTAKTLARAAAATPAEISAQLNAMAQTTKRHGRCDCPAWLMVRLGELRWREVETELGVFSVKPYGRSATKFKVRLMKNR